MISRRIRCPIFLLLLAIGLGGVARSSQPWTVIGAGNLTCREWTSASATTQKEVLSWMNGFLSALNVHYASTGQAFPLHLITNNYLRSQIDKVCAYEPNSSVDMTSVLFRFTSQPPFVGGGQQPNKTPEQSHE
jgi:hypothetical protein